MRNLVIRKRITLIHRLIWACKNNHVEVVKKLIQHGALVENSALSSAAEFGNTTVCEFLLDSGADIHQGDDYALRFEDRIARL
jgi:ankyrin repeat protein